MNPWPNRDNVAATLHSVGVITKLYFAIFAAYKESMTLNLAQRSFKVIYILVAIESRVKLYMIIFIHHQMVAYAVKINNNQIIV